MIYSLLAVADFDRTTIKEDQQASWQLLRLKVIDVAFILLFINFTSSILNSYN